MGGQNRCKRGKQSIKSLQQSGAQLTNIVVTDNNIQDITFAIAEAKAEDDGKSFTVKQMEKTKKTLQAKLQKLNDQSRKDDVVTFEQLGVDRLFVDESHFYKKYVPLHKNAEHRWYCSDRCTEVLGYVCKMSVSR